MRDTGLQLSIFCGGDWLSGWSVGGLIQRPRGARKLVTLSQSAKINWSKGLLNLPKSFYHLG